MTQPDIGFEMATRRAWPRLKRAIASLVWLLPSGCGDYASWNERWLFDGADGHSSTPAVDGEPAPILACEAAPIEGYTYADAPEFWLGTQATFELRVDGPGHLVAGTAGGDASELRYLRAAGLSVAADGNLELGGEPALGYPLNATPGGPCLGQLRAPNLAPAQATSRIDIRMNVDPRAPVVRFDELEPSGTSNASVSMTVFDSSGTSRYFDIYFSNLGAMKYEYHVVIDGGDLGGTPGAFVLVSTGRLQFEASGALVSTLAPPVDVSFAGAAPGQRIYLGFGPGTASGATGYEGTTSFASEASVFSLAVDGLTQGTSSGIDVRPDGDVLVYYDNGEALSIGSLALARFPREAGLVPLGWGLGMTPESGAPQLGTPQSPGRGMLVVGSVSAWP
jgi:flagellar hook protein FlgE